MLEEQGEYPKLVFLWSVDEDNCLRKGIIDIVYIGKESFLSFHEFYLNLDILGRGRVGTLIQILASPLCDLESLEVYNFSEIG